MNIFCFLKAVANSSLFTLHFGKADGNPSPRFCKHSEGWQGGELGTSRKNSPSCQRSVNYELGIDPGTIIKVCKGKSKHKTAGGYRWKFKEQ